MNTVECILYIDSSDQNPLITEGEIYDLVNVKAMEKENQIDKALQFIETGCLLDGKKCPEFIFIELGKKSIREKDFYESLLKVNQAIMVKMQVVFILDEENQYEVKKLEDLGIEYIIKPLNKSKLQSIFDRYFLLKNPVI